MLVSPHGSPSPERGEPSSASRPFWAIFSNADMSVRVTMSQGWHMTLAAGFPSAYTWLAASVHGGHGAAAQWMTPAEALGCIDNLTATNQRKVSTGVMRLRGALPRWFTPVCTYL